LGEGSRLIIKEKANLSQPQIGIHGSIANANRTRVSTTYLGNKRKALNEVVTAYLENTEEWGQVPANWWTLQPRIT
jgi:hypothetical protein